MKEIQFWNGLYLVSKSIINVRASLSGTLAIQTMGLKILSQDIVIFLEPDFLQDISEKWKLNKYPKKTTYADQNNNAPSKFARHILQLWLESKKTI